MSDNKTGGNTTSKAEPSQKALLAFQAYAKTKGVNMDLHSAKTANIDGKTVADFE